MTFDSHAWVDVVTRNLIHPPRDGEDVCSGCRSWKFPGEKLCSNCLQATEELASPCLNLIPISLYRKPSVLRDWLKFYKPGAERFEPNYATAIAAILDLGFARQIDVLVDKVGQWDYLVVVPSTYPAGIHPMEEQLRRVGLDGNLVRPLIRTEVPLGHRVMSDQAYRVAQDVTDKRFLLVDDVYTTGARSQSAASALQLAGGHVVAILVIGRRINVEYNEFTFRVWERQHIKPFNFLDVFK